MYDQAYSVHGQSQSQRSQAGAGPASRFKNHPSNSNSTTWSTPMSMSLSSTVTCLICAKDTAAECEGEQLTGISTNALVSALNTIFDIPSSFYDDLNLHSLPTPLYCSVCSSLIFNSLEILNNIQSLQSNLDVLKSELKTNLIRSYDDMDDPTLMASKPGADSDGGVAKEIIRQSLIQSWSEIDTDEDGGGGTTYVSEENSDSLLGLPQDPISGSDLYTAEEIPEEDEDDGDVGNDNEDDDNNCNMDFLDLQYEDDDRAEEEPSVFSVVRSQSQSRSQTNSDQFHQLNNNIPPNTTIFESDYGENGYENKRTNFKTEPQESKLLRFKAKPRQRGRVKGFLRIRKHRQNGRFTFKCGLCGKGYKKQRSFQMHLLCHREDSKKELLDKNDMILKLEPERMPQTIQIQPQTIYDTEVSVVEDDLEESFQVEVNPTDLIHTNNYQDLEQPSTSSMISEFNLTNFPGVEISPAVIKIEQPEQSSESSEISNYRVRPNHIKHAGQQGTSKSYFRPGGILKIRRNRQYRDSAYTCNFCGKAYSNYKSFVRHVKCHRGAAGAVTLDPQDDLDVEYKDRYRGIFRLSGRERKGKFRYRCAHCGKCYRNEKSFEIHVQCHSGEYSLVKPKPPTMRQARIKTDPDIFSLNPNSSASSAWTPAVENNSILPTTTTISTFRNTSTSRALASRRLKILSNNSKKQAASYKRQFRGILRIRNRNHGRSLPFKCNICGKGYKIARSFEKHLKFHTGELEVKIEPETKVPVKSKSKTKPKSKKIEVPESENVFSIETLNHEGNFGNELLNDGLHPTLFLSQSDPESDEGHDQDDPPPPVPISTTAPRRPGRGRPRAPAPKRRYRGIFRIRNYGRIGNFPYRCKVCGKGYKNVKSYNTHVVFHSEQGDCEVDDEEIDDEENPEVSLPAHLNSLEVTYTDESSAQSKAHRTENSPSTSTSSNFLHGIDLGQQQQAHFCEICEKTFSSAPRLKAHMTYAHTTSYEYHCEKCDLGLPSRPALYQHMQVHLQERQEEKDLKSFTQRSGIMNQNPNPNPSRRHSNSNSNDCRYVCKICGDRFPQYVNLKEHSAVHE